ASRFSRWPSTTSIRCRWASGIATTRSRARARTSRSTCEPTACTSRSRWSSARASMSSFTLGPAIGVLVLAVLHLVAGHLHRGAVQRPAWLSVAGGMSVAYVFVHLLPELSEMQARWLED